MILIIFFLIIGIVILTGQIFTDQIKDIGEEHRSYLFDYYSTGMNSFMNLRETNTNLPVHILIGNYISRGETRAAGRDGVSINVSDELENLLNEFYGENNYYAEIRQAYTDTTLSFVFDGSNSNRNEKRIIGERLNSILNSVNEIFGDSGVSASAKIYVLTEESEIDACEPFGDIHRDKCTNLNSNKIYGDDTYLVVNRPVDLSGRHGFVGDYVESDWLGGIVHAEKLFRRSILGVDEREQDVHVVIPVFDQLSSSSISDGCFDIPRSQSYGNYIICRLCDPECPVERTEEQLADAINYFLDRNRNSIVIPIFSFDCNFQYLYEWNEISLSSNDPYYNYIPPSVGEFETLCHHQECPGCRPATGSERIDSTDESRYQNVCFKDQCQQSILSQMNAIANPTGGEGVNIANVNLIADQITEKLEAAFERRVLVLGQKEPERTRYVFERKILLPTLGYTEVYVQIYELPK